LKIFVDGIIYSLQASGGVSVYFSELIRFLSRQKQLELSVDLFEPCIARGIDDIKTSHFTQFKRSRWQERYRSCQGSNDLDVFHSTYYRRPANSSMPTVVTVHDFIYERYQRGPRQLVHTAQKNAAIRAAQAVICISESTKQDLLEFVGRTPGQKIYVIHNGVADIFKDLRLESSVTPFVLFVGQRAGYKNFCMALAAMEFLPDFELQCVGGGPILPEELKGVSDSVVTRVRHLGFVSDEELNVLYNRALCLVYPSSYEGFGIPVIEAMRAGCPVVSTDCKAVLEVGRDALTVVTERDPRAIANAILNTTSSTRESLIQKGLAVAQTYSWDTTHRQTLEVYSSLSI